MLARTGITIAAGCGALADDDYPGARLMLVAGVGRRYSWPMLFDDISVTRLDGLEVRRAILRDGGVFPLMSWGWWLRLGLGRCWGLFGE